MAGDRESILGRVRAALAPLAKRAARPDYDAGLELARERAGAGDPLAEFTERLLAVNGEVYSADKLREAIKRAEKDTGPITLLVKDRDQIKSVALDYHGGLRYPHLERVDGTPARLDDILKPVE